MADTPKCFNCKSNEYKTPYYHEKYKELVIFCGLCIGKSDCICPLCYENGNVIFVKNPDTGAVTGNGGKCDSCNKIVCNNCRESRVCANCYISKGKLCDTCAAKIDLRFCYDLSCRPRECKKCGELVKNQPKCQCGKTVKEFCEKCVVFRYCASCMPPNCYKCEKEHAGIISMTCKCGMYTYHVCKTCPVTVINCVFCSPIMCYDCKVEANNVCRYCKTRKFCYEHGILIEADVCCDYKKRYAMCTHCVMEKIRSGEIGLNGCFKFEEDIVEYNILKKDEKFSDNSRYD
jgi:hypothetical protein